jgi:hypothetical protein
MTDPDELPMIDLADAPWISAEEMQRLADGIAADLERMVEAGMLEIDPAMLADLMIGGDHEPNV